MHRDRTLTLKGQRFHYAEWGPATAPPVLLLHGVTGHARTWDDEAAGLAARYRVLALDQRGHGDSDPSPNADYTVATMSADVAAFADALGLSRFSIVGLSMGGRVAIGFAGQAPARVERLVIVDIGPEISEAGMLRVGTLMARSPELFPSLEHALAFHRLTNPLYSEAMLRHRVQHGTRPVEGGLTWKYDRGLRDAVRPERGAIRSTSGRSGAISPVRSCSCAAPTPTSCPRRSPSGCSTKISIPGSRKSPAPVIRSPVTSRSPSRLS